jgi:hypothetical protein
VHAYFVFAALRERRYALEEPHLLHALRPSKKPFDSDL